MTVQNETTTDGIVLTDVAAAKVSGLLQQEGRDDLRLRIAVQPGGCSGLRYQLYFDERQMDGDVVSEFGPVQVVTDKMSVPYLSGATIDFVDTIEKQGFTIDNPTPPARAPAATPSTKPVAVSSTAYPETAAVRPLRGGSCMPATAPRRRRAGTEQHGWRVAIPSALVTFHP